MNDELRKLLIEILYQLLNTDDSSNTYVEKRLKLAGVTREEIEELTA